MARVAIVTGGSRGIGLAIVRALRGDGLEVVVGARQSSAELDAMGASFHATDVRERAQVHALVKHTMERHGRLDVMVNNAGVSVWRKLESIDEAFLRELLDTNLTGTLWGAQAAAEHMQPGGVILNVASLAGVRGSANNSVYCASKFGVLGLTQALAKELGPKGLRVNAVNPVYVRTEMLLSQLTGDHPEAAGREPHAFLDDFAARQTALGRLPSAEEVADTVVFLASERASAITGQSLNVDCGTMPR